MIGGDGAGVDEGDGDCSDGGTDDDDDDGFAVGNDDDKSEVMIMMVIRVGAIMMTKTGDIDDNIDDVEILGK